MVFSLEKYEIGRLRKETVASNKVIKKISCHILSVAVNIFPKVPEQLKKVLDNKIIKDNNQI